MSNPNATERWECGDCGAMLRASRTVTRHWKDAQRAGRAHIGPCYMIHHRVFPPPVANTTTTHAMAPPPSMAPTASSPLPPPPALLEQSLFDVTATDVPLQLRSSRSTRHHEQNASRNRPGVVDLDPTEGLPVTNWQQVSVKVNQDPSIDHSAAIHRPSGATTTTSAEWGLQFNTPQFPWAEKPFPQFFAGIPAHNQEFIRMGRCGNTNPVISKYDPKTNTYISGAEIERRNALKMYQGNNLEVNNTTDQKPPTETLPNHDDDDREDKSDAEIDGDNQADPVDPSANTSAKRRKKLVPDERTFEVKRWVQASSAVADRTEERKFLADRRPGMPSLYGGAYQMEVFGSMGSNTNGQGFSAANASYDFGDGGGLASSGSMPQADQGAAAPVRKNMPPKRKKKKGGPGRKKANPNSALQNNGSTADGITTEQQNVESMNDVQQTQDVTMADGDHDGSESESEGEGSEEGEIDEGGHTDKQEDHITKPEEVPANIETEQALSHANNDEVEHPSNMHDTFNVDPNIVQANSKASDAHPIQQTQALVTEPVVEDAQMEEAPIQAPVEPEIIPSITQPPVSEPLPEIPEPPITEPEPVPVPVSVLEPEPVAEPEPIPEPVTQAAQPAAQEERPGLPAITTTTEVGEAVEQASIPAAAAGSSAEGPPVVGPPMEEADVVSASAPAPPKESVPEPTSPDLLGGLEDELNKTMGGE